MEISWVNVSGNGSILLLSLIPHQIFKNGFKMSYILQKPLNFKDESFLPLQVKWGETYSILDQVHHN